MTENQKQAYVRLEQLEKYTLLLQQEIANIKNLLKGDDDPILSPPPVKDYLAIPHDPVSTLPEHLVMMASQIQEITMNEENENANRREELLKNFEGPHSLFTKYLSSAAINGGQGFIKPNDTFPQYEQDADMVSIQRLATWPAGFYRAHDTKEEQLLIHIDTLFSVIVEALPSNTGSVLVYYHPIAADSKVCAVNAMPVADLIRLRDALKQQLDGLTTLHF